jgi:DNA-binding IclR family transcriptional regulator
VAEISKTTDQALEILEAVIHRGPISAQRLARELELNRTACHRLLSTLHQRGYVRKEGSSYSVGHRFLRLATQALPLLLVRARPVLRELADAHGETVLLTVVDGDDAVAIDQVIGDRHTVRVGYRIGNRHPLVTGASGRALLAYLDEAHIARAAAAEPDPAALLDQLDRLRADGYGTSQNELNSNVFGVSVPVLDDGAVLASLTVVAPTDRADTLRALVPELRSAARRIPELLHER